MSMDLAQNLDDFIGEEYTDKQTFVIDSVDKADWAMRKIAKYEADTAEAKALAEKRKLQIEAWLKAIADENERQITFFTSLLEPFAKNQITEKKRSIKLPTGTFGFKKQQPEFTWDEKKLVTWAEENAAEYIVKEPALKWGEFKKASNVSETFEETPNGTVKKLVFVAPDGQIVPDITVVERPVKFYVKAGE
jgi:phosphoenolpyruvate carboxylase